MPVHSILSVMTIRGLVSGKLFRNAFAFIIDPALSGFIVTHFFPSFFLSFSLSIYLRQISPSPSSAAGAQRVSLVLYRVWPPTGRTPQRTDRVERVLSSQAVSTLLDSTLGRHLQVYANLLGRKTHAKRDTCSFAPSSRFLAK